MHAEKLIEGCDLLIDVHLTIKTKLKGNVL